MRGTLSSECIGIKIILRDSLLDSDKCITVEIPLFYLLASPVRGVSIKVLYCIVLLCSQWVVLNQNYYYSCKKKECHFLIIFLWTIISSQPQVSSLKFVKLYESFEQVSIKYMPCSIVTMEVEKRNLKVSYFQVLTTLALFCIK